MRAMLIGAALSMMIGTAYAQTGNTIPGAQPPAHSAVIAPPPAPPADAARSTDNGTSAVNDNAKNKAAASGNDNQAVATTEESSDQPAKGSNSFTEGQAKSRIEGAGFTDVSGLRKDDNGVWRGTAQKNAKPENVWLDYKGNVGQTATNQ